MTSINSKKIIPFILPFVLFFFIQTELFSFPFGNRHESSYATIEEIDLSDLNLEDGIYRGTANGFRPGILVEITIENSLLTLIEMIDHNESGRQYYQTPVRVIPEAIIEEQNTSVDAVSGATATSKGIMAAVEDALKKAIIDN